jgi:hypothetical protein
MRAGRSGTRSSVGSHELALLPRGQPSLFARGVATAAASLLMAGLAIACGTNSSQRCDESEPCPSGLVCRDGVCVEDDGNGGLPGEDDCRPTSCQAAGAECGYVPDGCGSSIHCGQCPEEETCGGAGPNLCGPGSCEAMLCPQDSCGVISDGCGDVLDCGGCQLPESCGGGGVANVCGCTPTTCELEGAECGQIPDGCGGELRCGTCPLNQACGGGGEPNVCGSGECLIQTCAEAGAECGPVSDGCGGVLQCGACEAPETCGGGGELNVCGCTATISCGPVECGERPDGCGGSVSCGTCADGMVCAGGRCR